MSCHLLWRRIPRQQGLHPTRARGRLLTQPPLSLLQKLPPQKAGRGAFCMVQYLWTQSHAPKLAETSWQGKGVQLMRQ